MKRHESTGERGACLDIVTYFPPASSQSSRNRSNREIRATNRAESNSASRHSKNPWIQPGTLATMNQFRVLALSTIINCYRPVHNGSTNKSDANSRRQRFENPGTYLDCKHFMNTNKLTILTSKAH
ncbi:hypothetical protein M758_1G252300 [Ceratodon purpureus]|nr:hypothetical protein M758_1G252300 [Ceratodon purpureus]